VAGLPADSFLLLAGVIGRLGQFIAAREIDVMNNLDARWRAA
jgi:hypothetical protein